MLDSRQELEEFLHRVELGPFSRFQQTWEWGEFEIANGNPVRRVGVWRDDEMVATAMLVTKRDSIAEFLHAPRGPVTDYSNADQARAVVRELVRFGRSVSPKPAYLRLDPPLIRGSAEAKILPSLGFRSSGRITQVERAWMIDVGDRTDDELLEWMKAHGMRSNLPRYFRRAEKLGVTVRASTAPADMETFLDMSATLDRRKGGIGLFPPDHYRRQLAAMSIAGRETLFITEKDGKPLCAALIAIYAGEGSYLHGASLTTHNELHAPHYMHWQIMRHVRDRGCRRYNMWGVVSERNDRPGRNGHGFSQFKRSFGGYVEHYIRSADFPYRRSTYPLVWLKDYIRGRRGQLD